jgi:predicted PhzF superfamily epimerase YddE/YHI9
MSQQVVQIDSFTDTPFAGNPAAVCLMEKPADPSWMQLVAREMNLSETAFLYPIDDGYHLRWFTPTVEVDLCGHGTLATAHLLFEDGHVSKAEPISFQTRSGKLTATYCDGWIWLDFPATRSTAVDLPQVLKTIKAEGKISGLRSENWLLAELASEQEVRSYQPDFPTIAALPGGHLLITARAQMPGVDFVSRCFAPGHGINEDPVTGSAHTTLGPFWMKKLGKSEFLAYQASARGGYMKVRVAGDRVHLGGQAVTIMRGELA